MWKTEVQKRRVTCYKSPSMSTTEVRLYSLFLLFPQRHITAPGRVKKDKGYSSFKSDLAGLERTINLVSLSANVKF